MPTKPPADREERLAEELVSIDVPADVARGLEPLGAQNAWGRLLTWLSREKVEIPETKSRGSEALTALVARAETSETPPADLAKILSIYRQGLEVFLFEQERRGIPNNPSRNFYAACGALNLLRVLERRFPEFVTGDESTVDEESAVVLEARAAVSGGLTLEEDLPSLLENHLVPLALLVQGNLSRWFGESRAQVLEANKEMRYGEAKWREQRIALDTASNHTPSDSGGSQLQVAFALRRTPGAEVEWIDVGDLEREPDPGQVVEIMINDDGPTGYPYDEVMRENPTKQGGTTVGEHGEGLLMAALAGTRRGIEMSYASRGWAADAIALPQPDDRDNPKSTHGWYLGYILRQVENRRGSQTTFRRPSRALVTALYGLKENLLCYVEHDTLGLARRYDERRQEQAPYGAVVLLKPGKDGRTPNNRVFVKGVYSTHAYISEPLLFSYDLFIPTPRDRDYIPQAEEHLTNVFKEACTPEMAAVMLAHAKENSDISWNMTREGFVHGNDRSGAWEIAKLLPLLEGNCPASMQQIFREAFRSTEGDQAVLATNSEATTRFYEQQETGTRGKKLVFVTKNMATFLRRACGVPLDWDVVQFPSEQQRTTSMVLESVDRGQHGGDQALVNLLRLHHQTSADGSIDVQFECEGMATPIGLKELVNRPELRGVVRRVWIQCSGRGIHEGALRLNAGEAGNGVDAVYTLPDTVRTLLACGVRPTVASQQWKAGAELETERVEDRQFTTVSYQVERYPISQIGGIRTTLEPLEGDRIPGGTVDALVKMSRQLYFLDPERYGTCIARLNDGTEILKAADGEGGLIFIDGQVLFRLSGARYNFVIPVSAVRSDMKSSNHGLRAETPMYDRAGGGWIELTLQDYMARRCGAALASNLPSICPAEVVDWLRTQLVTLDESNLAGHPAPSGEAYLIQQHLGARSHRGMTRDLKGIWAPLVAQALSEIGVDSERAILQNPATPRRRTVAATVGDLLDGERNRLGRLEQFRNARDCHGRQVVAATSDDLARFLRACEVIPLDTDLPMEYVAFAQRNPVLASVLRRTAMAAALVVPFMMVGRATLGVGDLIFGGETSAPTAGLPPAESTHEIFKNPTVEEGRVHVDLGNALKALLLGLAESGAAAGIFYGGRAAWRRRNEEAIKRAELEAEEARRAPQIEMTNHITAYLGFLDKVCDVSLFGRVRIEWTEEAMADVAYYHRDTDQLFLSVHYMPKNPAQAAGHLVAQHVLPVLLPYISQARALEVLTQILDGTLRDLLGASKAKVPTLREVPLDRVSEVWSKKD